MSELRSKLKEVSDKLNDAASRAENITSPFYDSEDRQKVDDFKPTSFLLIKSYDSDQGVRDITGPPIKRSSGIRVLTHSRIVKADYFKDEPNQEYTGFSVTVSMRCRFAVEVFNLGALDVPSAKVSAQLYLSQYNEHFEPKVKVVSEKMSEAGWISPQGQREFFFDAYHQYRTGYTNAASDKLIFEVGITARVFSFSPPDYKSGDLQKYEPHLDRRDAVAIFTGDEMDTFPKYQE